MQRSEVNSDEKFELSWKLERISLLAKGGMAVVYTAFQPLLGRMVAIKKLKRALALSEEIRARFRREARALASLSHPNIVHLYDYVDSEEPMLVMEYLPGRDLASWIKEVGPLSSEIAIRIFVEVTRGVAHLHEKNLIHRDIKPGNIRITNDGRVKLMDFGIAFDTHGHTLTQPGTFLGSPSYLAPEQVLGDMITSASDQFLIGICLYEALTGQRPFHGTETETVYQRIRQGKYVALNRTGIPIPRPLAKIVEKCLAPEPEKRFPDAKALYQALMQVMSGDVETTSQALIDFMHDDRTEGFPSAPTDRRTAKWVIGGVIAAALALSALFFI